VRQVRPDFRRAARMKRVAMISWRGMTSACMYCGKSLSTGSDMRQSRAATIQ
jgi:hypothetical protein